MWVYVCVSAYVYVWPCACGWPGRNLHMRLGEKVDLIVEHEGGVSRELSDVKLILWCEGGDNGNDVAMRVMGRLSSSCK